MTGNYRRLIRMLRTGKAQEIKETMEAAKGHWQVTAGVIPGTVETEHTLSLGYTSSDMKKDGETCERNSQLMMASGKPPSKSLDAEAAGVDGVEDTIFMKRRDEALEHARAIMDPQRVNWVRVDFIWY